MCGIGTQCKNTDGSFYCTCNDGFMQVVGSSGQQCMGKYQFSSCPFLNETKLPHSDIFDPIFTFKMGGSCSVTSIKILFGAEIFQGLLKKKIKLVSLP